jgi:hypothetical protein
MSENWLKIVDKRYILCYNFINAIERSYQNDGKTIRDRALYREKRAIYQVDD